MSSGNICGSKDPTLKLEDFESKLKLEDELLERLKKLPSCPETWYMKAFETTYFKSDYKTSEESYFSTYLRDVILCYNIKLYKKGVDIMENYLESNKDNKKIQENEAVLCMLYGILSWCYYKLDCCEQCLENLERAEKYYNPKKSTDYEFCKVNVYASTSTEGRKYALKLVQKLLLIEDKPEYHHAIGKLMGQIRWFDYPRPRITEEEIEHLTIAYESDKSNEYYSTTLAQSLSDHFKMSKNISTKIKSVEILQHLISNQDLSKMRGKTIARICFSLLYSMDSYSKYKVLADIALEKEPDNVLVNDYIGRFYSYFKKFENAAPCFEKTLETLPRNCIEYLKSMHLAHKNVDMDSFEEKYKKLYTKYEDIIRMYMSISDFHISYGDFEKACESLIKTSEYGPLDLNYYSTICSRKLCDLFEDDIKSKDVISPLERKVLLIIKSANYHKQNKR